MSNANKKFSGRSGLLPMIPPSLQFYSIAEVAIILGSSPRLVYDWINEGLLPSFRLGPKNRLIRIRQVDLERFIDTHIRNGSVMMRPSDTDNADL